MEKIKKYLVGFCFLFLTLIVTINLYKWIVLGEQYITMTFPNKIYSDSDLDVSIQVRLETHCNYQIMMEEYYYPAKIEVELLDSKMHEVEGVETFYEGHTAKLSIPKIEEGKYFLKAKIWEKWRKDVICKEIYIADNIDLEEITHNNAQEEYKINSKTEEKIAALISICALGGLILMMSEYLYFKVGNFYTFLLHLINILVYTVTIIQLCTMSASTRTTNFYPENVWLVSICAVALCLFTYIIFFSRLHKKIYKTSILITISQILFAIFLWIAQIDKVLMCFVLLLVVVLLLWWIIKNGKLPFICKYIFSLVISVIVASIFEYYLQNDFFGVGIVLTVSGIYFLNYFWNKLGIKKDTEEIFQNKTPLLCLLLVLGIVAGIETTVALYELFRIEASVFIF